MLVLHKQLLILSAVVLTAGCSSRPTVPYDQPHLAHTCPNDSIKVCETLYGYERPYRDCGCSKRW